MGCVTSADKLEHLGSKPRYSTINYKTKEEGDYTYLGKGGIYMKTSIGPVQFGIPPETIKDCLNNKLEVPQYFIIPSDRFERRLGLSVAEFEFPAYFNFFAMKRVVNLIVDAEGEESIRTIFQETLLGPKDLSSFDEEFQSDSQTAPSIDLRKELDSFAVNPFKPTEKLTIDTLIQFIRFDENGVVNITGKEGSNVVKIVKKEGYFQVYDNNQFKATFNDIMKIDPTKFPAYQFLKNHIVGLDSDQPESDHENHKRLEIETPEEAVPFSPPDFGITVLGNSHGFDSSGSTSGFIIWVNKRGVMVDPPPFCSEVLRAQNVPPNIIDKIILTHCHADHDAGAFQKVLDAGTVEIITTPTIMGSFQRKYSAMMSVQATNVMNLFEYRPIPVYKEVMINGATFNFFYSLHSIPCLGFEASLGGKSIYFSGDTYYDPEGLKLKYEKGLFSKERYEQLAFPKFEKYDIILHESGVAPIHTPLAVLGSLPEAIKKNIRLYHIAEKDIKPEFELKYATLGLQNTIILDVNVEKNDVLHVLEVVSQIDILNQLPLKRICDLVRCLKEKPYKKGQFVLREGTKGKEFYLVKEGICKVYSRDPERKFSKLKYSGDYFGESAVTGNGIRNASVQAFTDCVLLSITKDDFQYCFGISKRDGNNRLTLYGRIENLTKIRGGVKAEFITKNSILSNMTELQKTDFSARLIETNLDAGKVIWSKENLPSICFILVTGVILLSLETDLGTYHLKPGHFVGDFPYLVSGHSCKTALKIIEHSTVFAMDKGDFVDFLRSNPGLLVFFKDKYIVE